MESNKPSKIVFAYERPQFSDDELDYSESRHKRRFDTYYALLKKKFNYEGLVEIVQNTNIPGFIEWRKILFKEHTEDDLFYHVAYYIPNLGTVKYLTCKREDLPLYINLKDGFAKSVVAWRLKNGK